MLVLDRQHLRCIQVKKDVRNTVTKTGVFLWVVTYFSRREQLQLFFSCIRYTVHASTLDISNLCISQYFSQWT